MSAILARSSRPALPGTRPEPRPDRLRVAPAAVPATPARRARPRVAYALTAIAGVAVIVVAQLLLSVGISQGAYEISTLQERKLELGRTADSVNEQLIRLSAPQNLAANAEALGMVSNSNPVYLRLSDGAVLGAPSSAPGAPGGAASLVPNALLAGVPLLTDAQTGAGQGTGIAGPDADPTQTTTPAPKPASPLTNGLPSPTTH